MNKTNIVFFLLVINALVAITSEFEITGSFHTGLWRAVIMAAAIPFLFHELKLTRTTKVIFVVIVYLFITLITNTYFWSTFSTYISVVFSLIMYPIAYTYIYKPEHYRKLFRIIIALLLIFSIHFIWAQVFRVGQSPYIADLIFLGGGGVQQTYIIVYFLLFIPFILVIQKIKLRKLDYTAMILSLAPIFLIFRRAAVFGLIFGLIFYTLFTPQKGKLIRFVLAASLIAVLLSPLYLEQLRAITEFRSTDPDEFVEAGRTTEIIVWAPELMSSLGLRHALFGSELYHYQLISGGRRSLHSDYATYLIGAGIIGFILYFSVLLFIWKDFIRNANYVNDRFNRKEAKAVLLSLTIAYLIISYSGQYYVVSSLSLIMMFLGIINRYMLEKAKESII